MMSSTPPPRLTSLSHGGGCGCKIAPGLLADLLKGSAPAAPFAQLLVGWRPPTMPRLSAQRAPGAGATTDFFMPIVDDPFDFGRIAAANALSDVYAMVVRRSSRWRCSPCRSRCCPPHVIREILRGGEAICAEAGIPIAGGHSIDSVEPIYGLAPSGSFTRASEAQLAGTAGDALILGKPLGVGILSAALKKGQLPAADYRAMTRYHDRLNRAGPELR